MTTSKQWLKKNHTKYLVSRRELRNIQCLQRICVTKKSNSGSLEDRRRRSKFNFKCRNYLSKQPSSNIHSRVSNGLENILIQPRSGVGSTEEQAKLF